MKQIKQWPDQRGWDEAWHYIDRGTESETGFYNCNLGWVKKEKKKRKVKVELECGNVDT